MKTNKDLPRLYRLVTYMQIKATDYNIPKERVPEEFFEELLHKAKLYGVCLDTIDAHIRDVLLNCSKLRPAPVDDKIMVVALQIIREGIDKLIKRKQLSTDIVLMMQAKDLYQIVLMVEPTDNAKKIISFALCAERFQSAKEREAEAINNSEDWIDEEEEEDDENQFIDDADEY